MTNHKWETSGSRKIMKRIIITFGRPLRSTSGSPIDSWIWTLSLLLCIGWVHITLIKSIALKNIQNKTHSNVQWFTLSWKSMTIMTEIWDLIEAILDIMITTSVRSHFGSWGNSQRRFYISACCWVCWESSWIRELCWLYCVLVMLSLWSRHSGCLLEGMVLIIQPTSIKLDSLLAARQSMKDSLAFKVNVSTQQDISILTFQFTTFHCSRRMQSSSGSPATSSSCQSSSTLLAKSLILTSASSQWEPKWSASCS